MKIWFIVAVAIPAFLVAAIASAIIAERRRKQELRAVAERLGLSYADKDDAALAPLRSATKLFDRGSARRFTSIMHGRIEDLSVYIFDYAYTTGTGEETQRHRQTMAAIFAEQSRAPKFELRPERVFHKVASFFGYEDIDVSDHPAFSRMFHLKGDDAQSVLNAFPTETCDRLMQAGKMCIESTGQWVIVYRPDKRLKPHEIDGFLREAFELTTLFV
ncbi:MAG: hypothetical protein KDA20_01280 [Phycisphaerales bacterium]|nr:hypothetical protein [Phycisphaerales bacterium]